MRKTILALGLMIISLNAICQYKAYTGNTPYVRGSGNQGNSGSNSNRNSFSEKTFATMAEAEMSQVYYLPTDNRNYNINPVDGVNTVAAPLPLDAVMKMPTTEGIRWTKIEEGTICRFQVMNGQICQVPYALHHCGNAVLEIKYLIKEQAPAAVTIQAPPVIFQEPQPTVHQQQIVVHDPSAPRKQQTPCVNCPGEKAVYNYNLGTPPANLQNNGSSMPITYRNYSDPVIQYPTFEQPVVAYARERKGWPTWAKVVVPAAILGTASYFIFKKSPSEPVDQEVITLPPTAGMIGMGFKFGF